MRKEGLRMVVIGSPGAGKDTQAGFLAREYQLKVLSVGAILRDEVRKKTPLGKRVRQDLESGNLVDDEIVDSILLKAIDGNKRILIDGFPRDLEQAREFKSINFALYLDCKKNNIVKRLLKRAKIEGRKDDNKRTIARRWRVFVEETLPVVVYYRKRGILREVDGNGSIEEVRKLIAAMLKKDVLFQRLLRE